jgi:plasmid replication initiation protein
MELVKIDLENTKNNLIVKRDNTLIDGKYALTLHQAQFVSFMVSLVKVEDSYFKEYEINLSDLLSIMRVRRENWRQLSRTLTQLLQKIVVITDTVDEIHKTTLLSSFRIINSQDVIKFSFHDSMKPLLLQLKSKFTQVKLEEIFNFKSVYSIKFYEILKRELDRHNRYKIASALTFKYDLEELKEIMVGDYDLKKDKVVYPKTYHKYNDFKKRILVVAQTELKAKSRHYFTFEEKKTKRKVTSLIFTIHATDKKEKQKIRDEELVQEQIAIDKINLDKFEHEDFKMLNKIRKEYLNKSFFRPFHLNEIFDKVYFPNTTFFIEEIDGKPLMFRLYQDKIFLLEKEEINMGIKFLSQNPEYLGDMSFKVEDYIGLHTYIKVTGKDIFGNQNNSDILFKTEEIKDYSKEEDTKIVKFSNEKYHFFIKIINKDNFIKLFEDGGIPINSHALMLNEQEANTI